MTSRIISNTEHEPCNHGWIHHDRISTIDYASFHIPELRERKSASLSLTLQTAGEFFNQGIQLIDQDPSLEPPKLSFRLLSSNGPLPQHTSN